MKGGEENMKELRETFKMYDTDDKIYVVTVVIKSPQVSQMPSSAFG